MADTNTAGLPALTSQSAQDALEANQRLIQSVPEFNQAAGELDKTLLDSAIAASRDLTTIRSETDLRTNSINTQINEELQRFNQSVEREGEILSLPVVITNMLTFFGDSSFSVQKQKRIQAAAKSNVSALSAQRAAARQAAADARAAIKDRFSIQKDVIDTSQESLKRTLDSQETVAEASRQTLNIFRALRSDQREEVRFFQDQQDRTVSTLTVPQLLNAQQQSATSGFVKIEGRNIPTGLVTQELARREEQQLNLANLRLAVDASEFQAVDRNQGRILNKMTRAQVKDALADGGKIQFKNDKNELVTIQLPLDKLTQALNAKEKAQQEIDERNLEIIETEVELGNIDGQVSRIAAIERTALQGESISFKEDREKLVRMINAIGENPTANTAPARKRVRELIEKMKSDTLARIKKIVPSEEMPVHEAMIEGVDPTQQDASNFFFGVLKSGSLTSLPENDLRANSVKTAMVATIREYTSQFNQEVPEVIANDEDSMKAFMASLSLSDPKFQKLENFQAQFALRLKEGVEGVRRQKLFELAHATTGTITPQEADAAGQPQLAGQNRYELAGIPIERLTTQLTNEQTGQTETIVNPVNFLGILQGVKDPLTGQPLSTVFLNNMADPNFMDAFAQFMSSDVPTPSQVALDVLVNGTSDPVGHLRGLGSTIAGYRSVLAQPAFKRRNEVTVESTKVLGFMSRNPAIFVGDLQSPDLLGQEGTGLQVRPDAISTNDIQLLEGIAAGGGTEDQLEQAVGIMVKIKRKAAQAGIPFDGK